jgi:hypothetical protein
MPQKPTEISAKTNANDSAPPTQRMNDAAALQVYGFNTVNSMGLAWVEALSSMGSEVLSFVADRIKEDVKTQHQILHCKDIGDLRRIQADFINTAIEQYSSETGKLVEMGRDLIPTPEAAKKAD